MSVNQEPLPQYLMAHESLTTEPPTQLELAATATLDEFLREHDIIDTEEMGLKRQEVLQKVSYLINEFVRIVAKKTGDDAEGLERLHGRLVPYGSYRLGVVSQGSDIDCITVVPSFVKRSDFFSIFYEMLQKQSLVEGLIKIENAYSPIMTCKFDKVELDLSFAALAMDTIPDDISFDDDHLLDNIDEESVRSLNGRRVNDMLLQLVPDISKFRIILRFLRIWAKKRCVYGNVYGYLGGVNLAILSAFICQRHRNKSPAYMILMFFYDMATWKYPEPIYINTPSSGPRPNWDQSNPQCHKELMPIITPSYPSINSLRSATKSSRNRMVKEFRRGYNACKEIIENNSPWDSLIQSPTFFVRYKKFIEIDVWADDETSLRSWTGFVSSRVRKLSIFVENTRFIDYAYVFPVEYRCDGHLGHPIAAAFFIGLQYHIPKTENTARTLDLSGPVRSWIGEVRDKAVEGQEIDMQIVSSESLPSFVFPDGERPVIKSTARKPAEKPE